MSTTLTGTFDRRDQADMAVERLVQEIGIERTDIFVTASGPDNSAGNRIGGADSETFDQDERDDVPLAGGIMVCGLVAVPSGIAIESIPLVIIGVPSMLIGFGVFAALSSRQAVA